MRKVFETYVQYFAPFQMLTTFRIKHLEPFFFLFLFLSWYKFKNVPSERSLHHYMTGLMKSLESTKLRVEGLRAA